MFRRRLYIYKSLLVNSEIATFYNSYYFLANILNKTSLQENEVWDSKSGTQTYTADSPGMARVIVQTSSDTRCNIVLNDIPLITQASKYWCYMTYIYFLKAGDVLKCISEQGTVTSLRFSAFLDEL